MNQENKPPLPMFSALKKKQDKEQRIENQKIIEKAQKAQGNLFDELESSEKKGIESINQKSAANEADFMSNNYHEKKEFLDIRLERTELYDYTFDSCVFRNCSFTRVPFTNTTFNDCDFYNCELILCKQDGTTFNNTFFKSSRLTGINFTDCAEFGFDPNFLNCLLDSCVFYDNTLNRCKITECTLRNTDFSNCRLKETDFSLTRFQDCSFLGCIMDKADFRSSTGYSFDPSANKIKGARFSLPEAASFLKYLGVTIE